MTPAKRFLDLMASLLGLFLLFPLFAAVAILIKFEDGGPVFFRQERVGRHGKHFRMFKFRTMTVRPVGEGSLITVGKDPRITRVGNYLRALKVDELPQLINVLKGEMSLVGPRPEVPYYVSMYTAEQRQVLEAVPGITDPASIRFRHESEVLARAADPEAVYVHEIMPEKIRLNLEYRKSASFVGDLKILFETFRVLAT